MNRRLSFLLVEMSNNRPINLNSMMNQRVPPKKAQLDNIIKYISKIIKQSIITRFISSNTTN